MPYKQGRGAPHFSMDLSSVLDKKVGDFNKKGIWKPYKLRAGDSERLYYRMEEEHIDEDCGS